MDELGYMPLVRIKTLEDLHNLQKMVVKHNIDNHNDVDTGGECLTWGPVVLRSPAAGGRQPYVCLQTAGGNAEHWMDRYMEENGIKLEVFFPWVFFPWGKPHWEREATVVTFKELQTTDTFAADIRDCLLEIYKNEQQEGRCCGYCPPKCLQRALFSMPKCTRMVD